MTPTPHTDLKPGDVVIARANDYSGGVWSVFTVVKATDRRVTALDERWRNTRHLASGQTKVFRVAMSAADAETALRHLTDRHKEALRTITQQHTDRIMKLIGGNQ